MALKLDKILAVSASPEMVRIVNAQMAAFRLSGMASVAKQGKLLAVAPRPVKEKNK
jgi:hypothetical protein